MHLQEHEAALLRAIEGARAARSPIASRGRGWEVDLPGAYRVQAASGTGRILKGYKLGLLSPAKQAQMGISTPIFGRAYADMLLENEVDLARFVQPRVEPELAVILRDPVPPDATPAAAWKAIAGMLVAVDILDSVWSGYRFTVEEVVADNSSGGAFLLGPQMREGYPTGTLRLFLNGELRSEGPVEALGDPGDRLAWLAAQVGGLQAGQVVFLGSPAPALPAEPGVLEAVWDQGGALIARLSL